MTGSDWSATVPVAASYLMRLIASETLALQSPISPYIEN